MTLGFYYHIPLAKKGKILYLPSYFAIFINALAEKIDELILFMHEAKGFDYENADHPLKTENIKWVNLGKITPAWERFIFPNRTLKKCDEGAANCEFILVRAPSPLAPIFFSRYSKTTKIAYLVVGDYRIGSKYLFQPYFRKLAITFFLKRNDNQLSRALKKSYVIVNSSELYLRYRGIKNLIEIKTSTLTKEDFFERIDTCNSGEINLIYTGRIDLAKGLIEIIKAISLLINDYDIRFHIVGMEPNNSIVVTNEIKDLAKKLNLEEKIIFHPMKRIGQELNSMYRMADIFVLPSYHEGFPRTIWEAMANSLPVICSSVGSIPYYLQDQLDCILVPPKDFKVLAEAIRMTIVDQNLRRKIIHNGYKLAQTNILEVQIQRIINFLSMFILEK